MKSNISFILIIFLFKLHLSAIPSWTFSSLAIDLLTSNYYEYNIYSHNDNNIYLNKEIRRDGNGIISTNNILKFDSYTRNVQYESIDSTYKNTIRCPYLVCPNGNFHLKKYENSNGETDINPRSFDLNGKWTLRCYWHDTGHFILFYSNNGENNLAITKNNGESWISYAKLPGDLFDFKLTQGSGVETGEYPIIYLGNKGGTLKLISQKMVLKSGVNENVNVNGGGGEKEICQTKTNTQAYFYDENDMFYYITYDDTNFESGYSTSTDIGGYISLSYFGIKKNEKSPFSFVDNIEIKEINLIKNSQYAYYEIYNKDKDITYHGLIDIKLNKVMYNFEDNIQTFIPFSRTEMWAVTSTSAYKICIVKSGNSCIDTCLGSNNLMLDPSQNKCQSNCDEGKIKLMPEEICIDSSLCDTNTYVLNDGETECGSCQYINQNNENKIKLMNTFGCISQAPEKSYLYNSDLNLYKCNNNYHPDNYNCVPDFCFEYCIDCSEPSTNAASQKCLSCKQGYTLDNEGNCIIVPTTVIVAPTTLLIPPTTVITPPTTVITPPTTVIIPPTTVIIPPTTVIIPPTTVIKPSSTIAKLPTTEIISDTSIIIPLTTLLTPSTFINLPTTTTLPPTSQNLETEYIEKCTNERCLTCNAESDRLKLCLTCDETKYKKVNYTKHYSKYYDCVDEKLLEIKYYKDDITGQYKPCNQYCKKCSGPGNLTHHNCMECDIGYMFRPGDNPHNNCVVYSDNFYLSAYNEYKPLSSPQCPEEAKYKIITDNGQNFCIYDCKADKTHKYLYNGNCLEICPNGTINSNYICKETDPDMIYVSENPIYLDNKDIIETIEILAKSYSEEFNYTDKHISSFRDEDNYILLYKNPRIIGSTNLKIPDIDFGECYEEVKKEYNITENLIISVIDKKVNNNPSTFYLFFHPITGVKLEVGDICQNKSIIMKENLLSMLDENNKNYELQKSLTEQGINIFDINDPYYKDICYDFDNPKNRDMALKDRIKETYVNVTLCDDGCTNTGIDLKNNVASCDCKFNEVTNNDLIHENAALEYVVGEFFELVNSSNILVVKCYKYLLKYFTRSIGAIIILVLFSLCLIFAGIFFSCELIKMKRYIFSLTEKYTSFIANYSNVFNLFPPKRKSLNNKSSKVDIVDLEKKRNPENNPRKSQKESTARTINLNSQNGQRHNSKEFMLSLKQRKSHLMPLKENIKEFIGNPFIEEGKKIKKFFKDYLATLPDDMEFDDAIKKDKRGFCRYFLDIIMEKQSFAYTFFSSDPINTKMIKFILFSLNISLYFVVCGLFFSEDYISELYHIDDKNETFFSFIPRTIDKVIYTTFVAIFIGYLTNFFFLDEKKVKGIFKREKDNRMILKRSIAMLISEIQKRYISFIIMTLFILLISLYYILCFNYVYPKTQTEWIKSSILIIIIMQILSILKCLFETIFRFLSFKCESEKLYKFSKILDNNS